VDMRFGTEFALYEAPFLFVPSPLESPMFRSLRCLVLLFVGMPFAFSQDTQESIDMFDAIDKQLIEVRYIPIDSKQGTLLMSNLVDRVVYIKMPDGFAAQPILAQFGQPGGGNGFGQAAGGQAAGGQNGGGGAQSVGGNANGAGAGAGAGQNGGMFRIPPGRSIKQTAVTVCLEHGKPDPKPQIPYRLMRLETLVQDPVLASICTQLNSSQLDQVSGQAAAWHVANKMSWEQLSKLPAHQSKYLPPQKLFSAKQIQSAQAFVDGTVMTLSRAADDQPQTSENSDQTY
jgi:hypothetical protein